MGEAKRRQAEIAFLKSLSPEEAGRWQRARDDEPRLDKGIDPGSPSPELTAAMTRQLYHLLENAKRANNVDEPVAYLHSRVDVTIQEFSTVAVACRAGCSHCCQGRVWVGISALEALYIAKRIAGRDAETIDSIRKSYEATKGLTYGARRQQLHPCPMLENDVCSIYEYRPETCRLAASADAHACARACHNLTNEQIPVPVTHQISRARYGAALSAALHKAGLKDSGYEFSAAILRALETPDAETAWLSGEDVFAGVLSENISFTEEARSMLDMAFKS